MLQLQKTKTVEAQRVLVHLREAGLLRNFPMQFRDRKKRTGKELGQKPHVIISPSVTTNFHSFQLSKMPEPKLSKEQRVELLIRQKNQDQAFQTASLNRLSSCLRFEVLIRFLAFKFS